MTKTPRTTIIYALIGAAMLLPACASAPDATTRATQAQSLATQKGWVRRDINTPSFTLASFTSASFGAPSQVSHVLRVYIEGDGYAWVDRRTPSRNPTPINPVALKLAVADSTGNAVYLGRPCQYVVDAQCHDNKWWTGHRFAPEVLRAYQHALDALKTRYNAQDLELVGYSGGGVIAALLAAERGDVRRLISVASPLDTDAWVAHHRLSPLMGSDNPARHGGRLGDVWQMHFVGGKDTVVPESVVRSYVAKLPAPNGMNVRVMADYTHYCCWAENWGSLAPD